MSATTAVLVMAYGTPSRPAQLEAYYTHIRRGRRPPPELLAELRGRYEAIGGRSPLLEITRAQASGLRDALRAAGHGDVRVEVGMKHSPPFLEDAARQLVASGVDHVVGLVLAPHYSRMSVQAYGDRVQAALEAEGGGQPRFTLVHSWATEPGYVRYLETAVGDALARLGSAAAGAEVVFTAHSLPERILAAGDPYPNELRATAEAVARAAGLERWSIAWQSAGRTSEPWIGPDVLEVLPRLVGAGATGVVVCPAGFVADHLEVLYDLDVEAAAEARTLGLPFARTAAPNADPAFAATLAGVVAARLPSRISAL
ncbi:MAG: protoporphyrin/coproporphyrin ferrochelatase [Solirubrobacteraceae bacterium]|nr:protoporphyrin/coproporphyrin ferrochelatase [Solirubrobacteraceae bacterium]